MEHPLKDITTWQKQQKRMEIALIQCDICCAGSEYDAPWEDKCKINLIGELQNYKKDSTFA